MSNGTPKLRAHYQKLKAEGKLNHHQMPKAGRINWEGEDRAHIWTHTAWCAGITMTRGDLPEHLFKQLVEEIAASVSGYDVLERE